MTHVVRARSRLAAAAATCLALAAPALVEAHHSAAPHYDLDKEVTLSGVVTKFEFVNPHAYVYFDVSAPSSDSGSWRCELQARTALQRLGWTPAIFPVGGRIEVVGAPARREAHVCMLTSFSVNGGTRVGRNEDVSRLSSPSAPRAVTPGGPVARAARLSSGEPNLSGTWVSTMPPGGPGRGRLGGPPPGGGGPAAGGRRGRPGGAGGPPNRPELTPAGVAAAERYDQRFDDPATKCSPANILFGWTHDQHVNEIVQRGSEIVLRYGYMDLVRTVHMNAVHPKTTAPSLAGHSIGRWDGDVLEVDTVGVAPGVLIPIAGMMHSEQLHVVERFSIDATARTLTRTYRAEDPLFLKTPYVGTDVMALAAESYTPYNCVELSGRNNIRPAR